MPNRCELCRIVGNGSIIKLGRDGITRCRSRVPGHVYSPSSCERRRNDHLAQESDDDGPPDLIEITEADLMENVWRNRLEIMEMLLFSNMASREMDRRNGVEIKKALISAIETLEEIKHAIPEGSYVDLCDNMQRIWTNV